MFIYYLIVLRLTYIIIYIDVLKVRYKLILIYYPNRYKFSNLVVRVVVVDIIVKINYAIDTLDSKEEVFYIDD